MKKLTHTLITPTVLLFCLASSLEADTQVRGKSLVAKRICNDIIIDSTAKLHRHLKAYRRSSPVLSKYYKTNSPQLHRHFSCNSMQLLSFARHIGSEDTAEYLWNKEKKAYNISIEEVTASTIKPQTPGQS